MKFSTHARQMFAAFRTRIVDAAVAVADTCFFRRRLKRNLQHLDYLNAELHMMNERLAEQIKALNIGEESARAQLCQLRVSPESVRGRTGFMVSAFVPTDVLTRLQKGTPQQRLNFQMRVSKILVEHALNGLFRVTAKGTMTAMQFRTVKNAVDTRIFETADGENPVARPPTHSLDIQAIRAAQSRGESQ